jgi:hypothetical protein
MPNQDDFIKQLARRSAYHQALGQFLDMFSNIEAIMHLVLRYYAQTPEPIALAIFSGVRVDGAMNYVNRIIEVVPPKPELQAELKYVFEQLSIINKVRNDLVHHGASYEFDARDVAIVTNAPLALTEDRIRSIPISTQILSDLITDLQKIQTHLAIRHIEESKRLNPASLTYALMKDSLTDAWRYKPPQPKKQSKKSGSKSRKQSRQHGPSQT